MFNLSYRGLNFGLTPIRLKRLFS